MNSNIIRISLISSLIFINTAMAQTKEQKPKKIFYSIGAGAALLPEYAGAENYRILPMINFSANWLGGKYIRVNGLNTEMNVLSNRKWNFGPILLGTINRGNAVSNEQIALLSEIKFAFGAGLFAKYTYKNLDIKASYTQDISGVNDGGLANLEVGYTYRKKKIISRTSVNTSLATANYLNTYFGINSTSSLASGLSSYRLDAGFKDIGISSNFSYLLNRKWMLGTAIRYNLLIGNAAKSPIVKLGSEHQLVSAFFVFYRF